MTRRPARQDSRVQKEASENRKQTTWEWERKPRSNPWRRSPRGRVRIQHRQARGGVVERGAKTQERKKRGRAEPQGGIEVCCYMTRLSHDFHKGKDHGIGGESQNHVWGNDTVKNKKNDE